MNTPKTSGEPLTEHELLTALGSSGYPLEIRLLKAFRDGGMDPIIGFRIPGQASESREIDIIAHFTRHISLGDGRVFRVTLRLVMEAKSLEPGAAFVGFPWERPTDHELRVGRARFGGALSYRVLPKFEDDQGAVIAPGGLAEAFDPLNSGPVCVQWCVVRRTKPGKEQRVFADHDGAFWKGMDGVVRATQDLMVEHSTHSWPREALLILFEMPVLVVAAPQLWLHDATGTNPPTSVPSLILSRMFQLDDRVDHRLVDVVSEGAVPAFIEACSRTIDMLEERLRGKAGVLAEIADQQRAKLEEAELRAFAAQFHRDHDS